MRTETSNDYGTLSGANPSYALGALLSTQSINSRQVNGNWVVQSTSATSNGYAWYGGAVLTNSSYTPDTAQATVHTTTYTLGTAGQLVGAHVADGRPRSIAYVNDMAGQALVRDEADYQSGGDPHEVWYRFDGKQLGYSGNNGTGDTSYQVSIDTRATQQGTGAFRNGAATGSPWGEFDGQVTSITSYAQGVASGGGGSGGYTIRAGDSLSSIAAQLWGDAALWYKLAQANGMTADGALTQGRILNVPAGVQRSRFASDTWLPYDPAAAMGDTSPTTPAPQAQGKAKKNKCGVFGQILLVVIAVAVVALTRVPITSFLSGGPLGAGAAAAAATAGTTATIAGGVAAGALASAVSQGVGVATGIQDKFSWKGVALAGIAGGIGGAGGLIGNVGDKFVTGLINGVVGSLATQGIALATGLQSKFDWAGVAAAGVAAGIGAKIGGSTSLARAGASFASGIAGAAATSLVTGRDFGDTIMSQLPSIIGNTVGNLIAARVGGRSEPTSENRSSARGGMVERDGIVFNQDAINRAMDGMPLGVDTSVDPYRGVMSLAEASSYNARIDAAGPASDSGGYAAGANLYPSMAKIILDRPQLDRTAQEFYAAEQELGRPYTNSDAIREGIRNNYAILDRADWDYAQSGRDFLWEYGKQVIFTAAGGVVGKLASPFLAPVLGRANALFIGDGFVAGAETIGSREALRGALGRTGSLSEAKGVVFANREANKLGYELIDAPLTYRGNQGIDLPFFNPTTGRYAVWEAKGGFTQRSLSALSTDKSGIIQGSERFIDTRLQRYIRYGDGTNINVVRNLQSALGDRNLDSFTSFYGSRSTYQLSLTGAGVRPAVIVP